MLNYTIKKILKLQIKLLIIQTNLITHDSIIKMNIIIFIKDVIKFLSFIIHKINNLKKVNHA